MQRLWLLLPAVACATAPAEPKNWFDLTSYERAEKLFESVGSHPRTLRLESAQLRFIELGADMPGTPWLFVHGLGGTLGDFAPLVVSAGARHRVVAADLPGSGGSVSLDADFSVVAFARTLASFLDATGIERAHLVCHSLGGQICIAFALDFSRRVETLTVIDAAGTYAQAEFIKRIAKQGARFNTGGIRPERNPAISMLIGGDLEILRRLVADDPTLLTTVGSFRDNYRRRVRDIATPTLIIWGEEDPLFPVDYGVFLKENIPGSILRVVPGAAHTPQLSDPDLVLRWVEEFQKGAST